MSLELSAKNCVPCKGGAPADFIWAAKADTLWEQK